METTLTPLVSRVQVFTNVMFHKKGQDCLVFQIYQYILEVFLQIWHEMEFGHHLYFIFYHSIFLSSMIPIFKFFEKGFIKNQVVLNLQFDPDGVKVER